MSIDNTVLREIERLGKRVDDLESSNKPSAYMRARREILARAVLIFGWIIIITMIVATILILIGIVMLFEGEYKFYAVFLNIGCTTIFVLFPVILCAMLIGEMRKAKQRMHCRGRCMI